jgi:predicted nucleic acid-binding Zn finger protein
MRSLIEVPITNPTTEVAEDPVARGVAALADASAKRVERALELLRAGAVESLGNGRFRVRSGGGRGWWAVREGYCNCPDFAWRGVVPCKHIIAVQLARRLEQPAA